MTRLRYNLSINSIKKHLQNFKMGRTLQNNSDRDDDRKSVKYAKPAKHSKNFPGKGMRVINKWSEEPDDIDDLDRDSFNLDDDGEFEYNAKYFANNRKQS